jgi:hypothetical protein
MSNYSYKYDLVSGDQDFRLFVLTRFNYIEVSDVSGEGQVFNKAVHLEEKVNSFLFCYLMIVFMA